MPTEGEYICGAYLKLVEECDIVDYNVRPPGGGIEGLGELDVVGIKLKARTAFFCEVTTHLGGLQIGKNYLATIEKIEEKFVRQKKYAYQKYGDFHCRFQYWSPKVSKENIVPKLRERISDLELVVNQAYTDKIEQLRVLAKERTETTGNPFFRTLQILERLVK